MTALIETFDTPDGAFTIVARTDGAVLAAGWTADPAMLVARIHPTLRPDVVREGGLGAADAVRAYYADDLTAIDAVPVHQAGTALQQAGWTALRRITPGRPLTYSSFAAELGNPRAVRAAASVCARNAAALFVPCHRVLRGDGTAGGFAWGVDVKRRLLRREAESDIDAAELLPSVFSQG